MKTYLIGFKQFFVLTILVIILSANLGQTHTFASDTYCYPDSFVQAMDDKASQYPWLGDVLAGPSETPDGAGCYTRYEKGSIYTSWQTDASLVTGLIYNKWANLGWEHSPLGYPVTDELDSGDGRYNLFEYGAILWKKGTDEAFAVYGEIGSAYRALNYQQSALGYPTSDEKDWNYDDRVGGQTRVSWFEHGAIFWLPNTPNQDGSLGDAATTVLAGNVYDCWNENYSAHPDQYSFPWSAGTTQTTDGYDSSIQFAANDGYVLHVTEDNSGNMQSCTSDRPMNF